MLKRWWRGLLAGLVVAGSLVAPASQADDRDWAADRAKFRQALAALDGGEQARFERLRDELEGYPLHPYLVYLPLRRELERVPRERVQAFLRSHEGTPMAYRLRGAWLEQLAEAGDWGTYLRVFDDRDSVRLQCHALNARLRDGTDRAAIEQAREIWLSGRSRPEACDPVFEVLYEQELVGSPLVWQRIGLAMESGRLGLARYLARQLPPAERRLLETWQKVYRDPLGGLNDARLEDDSPLVRQIIIQGIERLARENPREARSAWSRLAGDYGFSPEQRRQVAQKVALQGAYRHLPEAPDWLSQAEPAAEPDVQLWELRSLIRQARWEDLARRIGELPALERESDQWRYWRGRAWLETGEGDRARELLARLAGETGYYGFLAADRLGRPYRFNHDPVADSVDTARAEALLEAHPGLMRAREFYRVDMLINARREWYAVLPEFDRTELQQAAWLAHRWRWHDRAIYTVARADDFDDLELRFPMPYRQEVEHFAGRHGLDPAWVYAVIRRESAFIADIRSGAGAVGLMQLLPGTAGDVARRLGKSRPGIYDLVDERLNLELGTAYLAELLGRFDDQQVLATAAYNAGPRRIGQWRPEKTAMAADAWVDTVTFSETRKYLRAVLGYATIYQWRLGERTERLRAVMSPVAPAGE